MAKVVLTFIDKDPGNKGDVECICKPSYQELAERLSRNQPITNAEAYAFVALGAVRAKSKLNSKEGRVIEIPTLKGMM